MASMFANRSVFGDGSAYPNEVVHIGYSGMLLPSP